MSDLQATFRGLFTLVRHIDPPTPGQLPSQDPHEMTIVFPKDDGTAGHAHDPAPNVLSDVHTALMILHKDDAPDPAVLRPLGVQLDPVPNRPDYRQFPLAKLRVWLPVPLAGQTEPVRHHGDERFSPKEDDIDVNAVGPNGRWERLSRLASLNALTGAQFDVDVHKLKPDESRLQSIVHLSGGSIECLRSCKPLGDAFVEFFTRNKGTLTIQPFSEDVAYRAEPVTGDRVEIGLARLHDVSPTVTFSVPTTHGVVLVSLPPENVRGNTLNHYRHYYPLMTKIETDDQPFLRVVAFWDGSRLRHTMPKPGFQPPACQIGFVTTGGQCSCAVASAFRRKST